MRSIASGVRSSWLAFATNCRSCSKAASSRPSISFSVVARREISSRLRGTGSRPGAVPETAGGAAAHRLDRSESGGGEAVAGEAGKQERERRGEEQFPQQAVQRLLARLERARHDDRAAAGRHREIAPVAARVPQGDRSSGLMTGCDAREVVLRDEERQVRRVRARHATGARHELGERRPAGDIDVDQASALTHVALGLSCLRGERLVDGGEERIADADVDEDAHSCEHDRHDDRERERQAYADRERPHACSSQAVADAAHGLDRLAAERPVDLLAQMADVDVDDVRAALVRHVPRAFEELPTREHAAWAAHQQLEQRELLRGEVELRLAVPGAMRGRVEPERADLDGDGPFRRRAAGERAQSCQELVERERLGEVVVGAGVEPGDPVVDRVARRQHQHRRPDLVPPKSPARLEAVDARQHDVEHDHVVRRGGRHPERIFTAVGDVGRVALFAEARARAGRQASAGPRR